MPLYFFDARDNADFIEDEMGVELPDLKAAQAQAALTLAELAREVLPGSVARILAIEVRNERQPVLRDTLLFEAIVMET